MPIRTGGAGCEDSKECGEGYCSFLFCHCKSGWQGPNCLVPTYKVISSSTTLQSPIFLMFIAPYPPYHLLPTANPNRIISPSAIHLSTLSLPYLPPPPPPLKPTPPPPPPAPSYFKQNDFPDWEYEGWTILLAVAPYVPSQLGIAGGK